MTYKTGIAAIDAIAQPVREGEDHARERIRVIQSSREFIAGFEPPDYLLDGILQKRFVYSLTAPTGAGKTAFLLLLTWHIATGRPMAGHEVEKGRVIYFAGENPDDVRMRWIVMADKLGFDPEKIDVSFVPGAMDIASIDRRLRAEAETLGGFSAAIVDTSAAYFHGADENSNVEMGKHARKLRNLTTIPGAPCVLVACHPVKNASNDRLVPRGGGAFVAEMDGNLIARKNGEIIDIHWQEKFRGPDFEPISLKLAQVTSENLKDKRERRIPTIMASPLSEMDRSELKAAAKSDEDQILLMLRDGPVDSIAKIAGKLLWLTSTGQPQKSRVHKAKEKLVRDKLMTQTRDRWHLTEKGKEEAKRISEGGE